MAGKDLYTLFFDGCSKGNPGKSGAGAVLYKNDIETWSQSYFVGEKQTNNYAEYIGLIIGLEAAVEQNITHMTVKGDSLLVIKQMRGEYNVSSPNIIDLYKRAKELSSKIRTIEFIHVYRAYNKRADALSNDGIL